MTLDVLSEAQLRRLAADIGFPALAKLCAPVFWYGLRIGLGVGMVIGGLLCLLLRMVWPGSAQ